MCKRALTVLTGLLQTVSIHSPARALPVDTRGGMPFDQGIEGVPAPRPRHGDQFVLGHAHNQVLEMPVLENRH